ncbi:MAG: class I SAM-dependent methyltransferase [Cyanosarcina radialis HA8281-LM2]|jgi:ubiquinone/menaquinone biosynthesis C-methylase UbiE|nr:class I SAM-dependent methyltransferase [Cyanosarcina radialis HA8281-LM2]
MIDIKDYFNDLEFDFWADKNNLIPPERFLIENYLDRSGKTLEAGTGGGRILLEMRNLGFTSLYGYDVLPDFIEKAKERDSEGSINFSVQDAAKLSYTDSSFEQVIYLQQLLCFLEPESTRIQAIQEAYRVLKPGGRALFSLVSLDVRTRSYIHRLYISYLSLFRKLRGSNRPIQYMPWLTIQGNKFNFGSIIDRGPQAYWFKVAEIAQIFKDVNFKIIAIGSEYQIDRGKMCKDPDELASEPLEGILYIVCQK